MAGINQFKRFLFKLILIAIIIFICDLGIGTILKFFYFRQESGANYRTTYAIDSTTAELLIFGSSRANHHYVPEIFEDSLHCTFYNTGREGNFILYNSATFYAIIKRFHPDLIIFDISANEIQYTTNSYERLSNLLPYYQAHPEIRRTVNLRSPFEKIKLVSSIYPYNSLLLTIAIGTLEYNKKRKPDNKGYIPIIKKMKYEKIDTAQISSVKNADCIDENKVAALKDIITICKLKNITLIFVQSPIFTINRESNCNSIMSEIFSENDVYYFNFSNHSIFINHPDYFADKSHLNHDGAKVFSSMVANKISVTLQNSNTK